MNGERPVVAVDPGRDKCGLAVVARPDTVLAQQVVPRHALPMAVQEMVSEHGAGAVVLGDRTGSKDAYRDIRPIIAVPIITVAEHETTMRARERYFRDHPAKGLERLLPTGLRTPARPVDDYAAILLGEAYWRDLPAFPATNGGANK